MIWGIVRGFFYVWFSAVVGFIAAFLTYVALSAQGPANTLPGGGWPLALAWPALILASLVSTQAGHFGKRLSLLKWISLCVVLTLAFVLAQVSSL